MALLDDTMRKRSGRPGLSLALLCLFVCGCHHRQAVPTLPAILKAPDAAPPAPAAPEMNVPPPASISTAPTVKVTEAKPKRRPRKATPKAAETVPVPAETAAVVPPAAVAALGELSAGGESNPKNQQEATDLIASSERRLEAFSKTKAGQGPVAEHTREVRHFLDQAKEALRTGDTEAAKTLATKAKLLMDDLEKSVQP